MIPNLSRKVFIFESYGPNTNSFLIDLWIFRKKKETTFLHGDLWQRHRALDLWSDNASARLALTPIGGVGTALEWVLWVVEFVIFWAIFKVNFGLDKKRKPVGMEKSFSNSLPAGWGSPWESSPPKPGFWGFCKFRFSISPKLRFF